MDPDLVIDEEMEPESDLNEITNRILGAAFEVHTELGPGYQEAYYAKALAIEFRRRGIGFVSEPKFHVEYKGELVGEGAPTSL